MALLVSVSVSAGQDEGLEVFQNLDEATARIARYGERPYAKLIDAKGFYQPETLIFHDLETGNEVVSLSMELCTDIANIERRSAWSSNGQYISFIGNKVFVNHANGQLWKRQWSGYNYVASADGSQRRRLWGNADGELVSLLDKFNNWDQRRPGVLYYAVKDKLWRVTLGKTEKDNRAEVIYTFPAATDKIIQEISDQNLMLIEESGDKPSCYVADLNKEPGDEGFMLSYPLKGEVHPGSFRFRRAAPIITGGYEDHSLGGIRLRVDAEKGLVPHEQAQRKGPDYKVRMWHLWYGRPDDRVVFSGEVEGKRGLWVMLPDAKPVLVADVVDGHPSWCGQDENWFFYAVGTGECPPAGAKYNRRLIAGTADGKTVKILCTPYDRRREGKPNYASIPRPNQSPDATKCWFHSSMLLPSDKYVGSLFVVFRKPYAPTSVAYADGKLSWTPHRLSREVRGYNLYRKGDDGWTLARPLVEGKELAISESGTYMLTAVEWSGLESDLSSQTITLPGATIGEPVKGFDKTAPAEVTGLSVRPEKDAKGQYRLTWQASEAPDLRYYNIYFSSTGKPDASQKRRIVSPPGSQTSYLDWTAPTEGPVYYAVTAVDRQGNESEPAYAQFAE
jgi:hypothetical protein